MKIKQYRPFFQFLDTNGNGTGTTNAIGNYASADTIFFTTPQTVHQRYVLNRIMIYIEDAETSISLATYGGATALTDGVVTRVVYRDGSVFDLSSSLNPKSNSDWARICYDVAISTFPAGNNYVHARWTWGRSGHPIVLNYGDQVQFVMRDNLTDLIIHSFLVHGYVE
ncbi:MAG: hypothetical protein ACYSWP_07070 [Planctomycetota bacterium]|jgi:hypothetical protein